MRRASQMLQALDGRLDTWVWSVGGSLNALGAQTILGKTYPSSNLWGGTWKTHFLLKGAPVNCHVSWREGILTQYMRLGAANGQDGDRQFFRLEFTDAVAEACQAFHEAQPQSERVMRTRAFF